MKKAVKRIGDVLLALSTLHFYLRYRKMKKLKEEKSDDSRYRIYFTLTTQWLKNKQENKELTEYFSRKNIRSIAIYGMGSLEELFYEDIKDSSLEIKYAVDQNAEAYQFAIKEFPVVVPEEIPQQPEVGAIVVTPIFAYEDICRDLEKYQLSAEIISLEDIIYDCAYYKEEGDAKYE